MKTKTEIIKEYLNVEGNLAKQTKVQVEEIKKLYGVEVTRQFINKCKLQVETPNTKVETVETQTEITEELQLLLDVLRICTNIFQMAEAIRQLDVYVQNNKVSIKDILNDYVENNLAPFQKNLIVMYGLDKRICFN